MCCLNIQLSRTLKYKKLYYILIIIILIIIDNIDNNNTNNEAECMHQEIYFRNTFDIAIFLL